MSAQLFRPTRPTHPARWPDRRPSAGWPRRCGWITKRYLHDLITARRY